MRQFMTKFTRQKVNPFFRQLLQTNKNSLKIVAAKWPFFLQESLFQSLKAFSSSIMQLSFNRYL
jgi:hypothetical protein